MGSQQSMQPATPFVLRDPETFFQAQQRNRRATWRMSALGVFAALIMGLPLTLALTPLVYAGTLLVAEIVNHFSRLPPEFWKTANSLARLAVRLLNYVVNHRGTLNTHEMAVAFAIVLLPGIVIAFVLWLGIMTLFRRGGVGGALASMNAREPNAADLKELQLSNTAQEMAIAAGLPAPKLMLVDSPGANAAAIGTGIHDARIVISRRLIDDLNRDQLQALMGHLIGSVGNGDLRIAFTVTSVFETSGLLITLINSPFGSHSRRTLWRIVRYALFRSSNREAEADAVCELLGGSLEGDDISNFFMGRKAGPVRKLLQFIFLPIIITNISIEITLWFFLNLLVGPCMALVWRTRRYLADASSVELTRNPDALAGALQRLAGDNSRIVDGDWGTHLFVVNPSGDFSAGKAEPSQEEMRQAAAMWAGVGGTAFKPGSADYAAIKREIMQTGIAAVAGDAAAAPRMEAFVKSMAAAHGEDASLIHVPDPTDLAAARQGDRAAIARVFSANRQRPPRVQAKSGKSGLQAGSMLPFHPPLKKRLKRLERMGAHLEADTSPKAPFVAKMFMGILLLIIVPLLAACAGLMLVVIAMLIGLNLLLVALWMAVIHAIFVWWNKGG